MRTHKLSFTTKPRAPEPSGLVQVNEDTRHKMIEEGAYYRALRRGFQGGDPFADWIEAEQEINTQLREHH